MYPVPCFWLSLCVFPRPPSPPFLAATCLSRESGKAFPGEWRHSRRKVLALFLPCAGGMPWNPLLLSGEAKGFGKANVVVFLVCACFFPLKKS